MSEPAVIEPGWYMDPFGQDRIERFNDGSKWTVRTRLVGSLQELAESEVRLRSTQLRTVLTAAVFAAIVAIYFVPLFVPVNGIYWTLGVSAVLTVLRILAASLVFNEEPTGLFVGILGERSIVSVVWRLTLLPYREDTVAAAELGVKWRRIVHPTVPGKALYVRISARS